MGDIGAIVLAAGGSRRLGRPKQLLVSAAGETLVHAAVRAAQEAGCKIVGVVTGEEGERVARAVADLHPRVILNDTWARGIGSSIRHGVEQLAESDFSALVLLACDQPEVDAAIVHALIAKYKKTGCAIIASRYAGTLGIPALFDRTCFGELQSLPDESGAKTLIVAEATRVAHVDFAGGAFDLDSAVDVQAWRDRCSEGERE